MNRLAQSITTFAFWRMLAALLSGFLLAMAFPPLQWDLLAWVAFVPILLIPQPRRWKERLAVGFVFGYAHFACSLFWLNNVGFGAGFLLSIWCALFPMLWYCLLSSLLLAFKDPRAANIPGESVLNVRGTKLLTCVALLSSAGWVALEWLRSWLFTGFSWNQLAISQYRRIGLLQTAAYTGPYGISFLILLVNFALTIEITEGVWMVVARRRRIFPWHMATLFALLIPVCILANLPRQKTASEAPLLDALVVQPDLPQARVWTEQEYQHALDTLCSLTQHALDNTPQQPQLVIWPECAVPAPLNYSDYRKARNQFLAGKTPLFLIGATHLRLLTPQDTVPALFNSAFLLDPNAPFGKTLFAPEDKIIDYYDKVHRVPFGEFTPGSRLFPWLSEWIGMGRDLTPGKDFHIIPLPSGIRAGVNICFEDVFPEISRAFTQRGANLLVTITNDSWYNRSCAAQQHTAHVIFRAVENRRPFLRCGSNSHSCLVTPYGEILGLLRDEKNNSDFIAGTRFYQIPAQEWGETFYTRFGDIFAKACAIITLACCLKLLLKILDTKKRQLQAISPKSHNDAASPDVISHTNA